MPILTDLAKAQVKDRVLELYGETRSTPKQLITDGVSESVYVCDVNIGPTDPTGRFKQYMNEGHWNLDILVGLPGQPDFHLGQELTINTILYNVRIARGNQELIYATMGTPVKVARTSPQAQWEITGFSRQLPGTYRVTPMFIPDIVLGAASQTVTIPLPSAVITIGETVDFTVTTRLLTLGELSVYGTFGYTPFGARGVFSAMDGLLRVV